MKKLMEYLEEYKDLLDGDYAKMNYRLHMRFIFKMIKDLKQNFCFRCKQEIESDDELSLDHKISYINNDPKWYFDINNIYYSHNRCNCGESQKGSGKLDYFGITRLSLDRPDKGYKNYVGKYCNKSLSCFETQMEAAICRDLAIFYYDNGKSRLNFEHFRQEYKDKVQPFLDNNRELFYKRGPIKDLVEHFYQKLLKSSIVEKTTL